MADQTTPVALVTVGEEPPPWTGIEPKPSEAQSQDDQELRAIKILVSVTLGITLVLSAGYIAAVVLSDGAILLRPSEVALERHEAYRERWKAAKTRESRRGPQEATATRL